MTRDQVYTFVGMSINAEKQAKENKSAITEETGVDGVATYLYGTPEIQVFENDMKNICGALSQKPEIEEWLCGKWTHKASLMIEGVKVFCICMGVPEWAAEIAGVQ